MSIIPDDLKKDITTLQWCGHSIHILGTAHVSRKSCTDAIKLINTIRPGLVFLELCNGRSRLLDPPPVVTDECNIMTDIIRRVSAGETNLFTVVYTAFLSSIAKQLEIMPGEEFRVAYEAATKINAKVMLGDRPVNVTLARLWQGLSTYEKISLIVHFLISGLDMLSPADLSKILEDFRTQTDLITEAVLELGENYPWLVESLINERDMYMMLMIRQAVEKYDVDVVAVVGAGHVPGIVRLWESVTTTGRESGGLIRELMLYPGCPVRRDYTSDDLRHHVKRRLKCLASEKPRRCVTRRSSTSLALYRRFNTIRVLRLFVPSTEMILFSFSITNAVLGIWSSFGWHCSSGL